MQEKENWDVENAMVMPPTKNPRAIVSVALSRDEFNEIYNRADGVPISRWLREQALRGFNKPFTHSDNCIVTFD